MPKAHFRKTRRQLTSRRVWRTRLVFWSGAVLVGLAATALAISSDRAGQAFSRILETSPYIPIVLTPLGLVLITWLTRSFVPSAEGSGIPQVIAALQIKHDSDRRDILSLRMAFSKGLLVILGIISGASIGREGPTVHIAAAITYAMSRIARFPLHDIGRGLIVAGAAAGLAAAFNTPLAGIVFVIEEIRRSYEKNTSGTILTAVIIAGMTALTIQGDYQYFGTVTTSLELSQMLGVVITTGVIGGLAGGLFGALLLVGTRKLTNFRNSRPYALALLCGLSLAGLGLASGGLTYGTGYAEAQNLVSGGESNGFSYALMKLSATIISYWSGIPGGIFSPSLSVGAGIGAGIAEWFPTVPSAAVILLGMVAYFTGVVQTPITAVVIIMEMTAEQSLLLPLMATALIAEGISKLINPKSIYRQLAMDFMKDVHKKKHGK
ncbi:H(+)/Cl(-) exchange transporter ClcA [bacterium BMS3Bbin11]|nr:H(+)/Cl(-) exchange transporter ClcA [bacterium BMS3Abin11]GBE46391.1 H(+)/Cl(-) exchange transporter ClcA [bacterium BMS3Bbin11]GMT40157.1 MAG: chloride channel protein [bacterium]HDH09223.1 chloride channel protein [Gammaproteobacteria bacterium]HDH15441.1 chloride channel protein [Gammaproteobacteria bacterium]